ncbi:MAG TPA: toll/interleukin-1 receptor domain-containing protein [Nitrososphaeraceae archaeon]|nr:toll/interleukin-1 receptor domain-containing protein [Nitrososphaeraceae archaeon]
MYIHNPKLKTSGQNDLSDGKYDAFISYASKDGLTYASQLKEQLEHERYGLEIWLAEKSLKLGEGLRSGLDSGLIKSNYKIVVLTKMYPEKYWTNQELNGMFAQEASSGKNLILAVCHNMSFKELLQYSPILAGRLVVPPDTALEETTLAIFNVIKQS